MNYPPTEYELKNGTVCTIRSPRPSDASAIIELLKLTMAETDFLLRYPDEITMTVPCEEEFLKAVGGHPANIMLCAETDGKITASAGLSLVMEAERTRHRASFAISIRKDYWGLGIGSLLLSASIESARRAGLESIELEVISENQRAVSLYESFGFRRYGRRPRSVKYRDGRYADEDLMILNL